ncbi:MAG: tryptophan-rich sensory protein [Clostridia bacterium]|nr:tryptophan-rich sensory protein [Clostridia bacterium]
MALKWINTIAFAAMAAVNALANLLPIGGNTVSQVTEAYPNLFTPAPVTFAIWGLIYVLMAVFVIYQWEVFDSGRFSAGVREDIGLWFAVSCALNIAWIFLWHDRLIGPSVLCIALLLISLIMIQGRLGNANGGFMLRMAARTGFSVYYGWIIAATIANISVWLTSIGWNGWGLPADFWTSLVLLVGAGIAFSVVVFGKNGIAGLAVMWAYAGILYKHLSPAWYNGAHPFVIGAGFLGEVIILTAIVLPLFTSVRVKPRTVSARRVF